MHVSRRWLLLLWGSVYALVAAGDVERTTCERLRVPRATVMHELIHLDSFENVQYQASHYATKWGLPKYKIPSVARQLLHALDDMARHETSEALVNLTHDHSLVYEVSVAPHAESAATIKETVVFTAERPVNETVAAFCQRFQIHSCGNLYTQLFALAVRDWGCHDEEQSTLPSETEAAAVAQDDEQPTHLMETVSVTDAASTASDLPSAIAAQAPQPITKVSDRSGEEVETQLPQVQITVDNTVHVVTVRIDEPVELQAAVLCRAWNVAMNECAIVTQVMRDAAKDKPAFTSAPFGGRLAITEPLSTRLYPGSERVYFDGEWLDPTSRAVDERRQLCLTYGDNDRPTMCGPFPPLEMWFIGRDTLSDGYHIVYFAEPQTTTDQESITLGPPIAARHFWVVTPRITTLDVQLRTQRALSRVELLIETVAFDLFDPEFRVCALVDDAFDCFHTSRVVVEDQTGTHPHLKTRFRVPIFGVGSGQHSVSLLLLNSYNRAFAHSGPTTFEIPKPTNMRRDSSYFREPASAGHVKRPLVCPTSIVLGDLEWICNLWRHEWGRYSQNGEDGVLESIFKHVGVTNRFYVEFGTEDARECNTRYLREEHGWSGLLMDGGHANATIDLHQEWISPENINELLAKYDVPREFDLLSIDVDFNDYWVLEAIDRGRFSPRVVMIEVNSHVPPREPRVIKYRGPATRWDGLTAYFGVGVGAVHLWGVKHGYSLVYCESHGVNCFLVRDDVLASVASDDDVVVSDELTAEDLHAPPNFFGRNMSYPWPTRESGIVEEWVWLDTE